ncbi:MaoC family dehydratase [Candidatus Chloroploca sp. M-50]|uniref:Beta-methylmalyl-CoA dehydratase n=1 Tax=Candidatus Chloroploca mongolica TaxID=2528176 RepID=A0ABS4DBP7_9CHLR|nr:MaoC family dehydratase [Candidatus Chloroploca mongolica]MBP1466871.1 MaoC family dehydratase [Candidatus Chloroploca mongolica]
MSSKTRAGNFFEDFYVGQELIHATPRTVTEGDVALYTALFGSRFALNSSTPFAQTLGLERAPLDSMLAFHIVFGKTVPDISLNAIANLGYANGRFGQPVYPGDTITTRSTVIGLRQNRDGKTGVVYVRSVGSNQHHQMVVEYTRWVMVRKKNIEAPAPEPVIPTLVEAVDVADLHVPYALTPGSYDTDLAGSPYLWEDYEVGERIDHVDGITIEEAEHMMAARLYQNTARVHFNQHVEREGRFGRRIIYGGHIISLARALSFNGLANALSIAAINGGRHTNPTFAGDTIYAWSEILAQQPLPDRTDLGALRVRTVALKDHSASDFLYQDSAGTYDPAVVLDVDYTVLIPRRTS